MASIFTYDPEVPRVASPWLTPADSPKPSTPRSPATSNIQSSGLLADYGVTKLEAEPQDGPTEYKLHLLLRPRRNYSSSSTASFRPYEEQDFVNDPNRLPVYANRHRQHRLEQLTTQLLWRLQQSSPYHTSSSGNLVLPKLPEHSTSLETPARPNKLLSGLEESRGALYEIGVSDDGTFVGLTKDEMDESLTNLRAMAASLGCNVEVVRMVAVGNCEWLETSDTKHDFDASLETALKLDMTNMATNEPNGESQSKIFVEREDDVTEGVQEPLRHQARLWVAEALVTPDLRIKNSTAQLGSGSPRIAAYTEASPKLLEADTTSDVSITSQSTEQLRITLTGPTTCGKSSLLGTLSTATLDNGRGKSRLSLLKHRHEIASGLTSSVAQELIGYKASNVVNYASGNVTSWTDIHATAENGRLVFVSDSAGHPRYRRTTVRGLVGWSPHWTILCVAADDNENAPSNAGGTSTAKEILGSSGAGIGISERTYGNFSKAENQFFGFPFKAFADDFRILDLTKAHLELCLKLDKPLAIAITKLDLASKSSLRQTLSKILTTVKALGRIPLILPIDQTKAIVEADLTTILERDHKSILTVVHKIKDSGNLTSIVPIVMTSSAKGTGIRLLHALLQSLPIPRGPTAQDFTGLALNPEQPASLFHIEDIFGMPASYEPLASSRSTQADSGSVVAGHLRFGSFSVGDNIVIGPFPAKCEDNESPPNRQEVRSSPSSFGASLSHPSSSELARLASRNIVAASVTKGEWHNAHIVSIRNLRLPVHALEAGQVGTIGIVFDLPKEGSSHGPCEQSAPKAPRVRKGMVIATPSRHMVQTRHTLQAASGFTASFEDGDINSVTAGSLVVVYIASVRASARVLRLVPHTISDPVATENEEIEDVFGLDDALGKEENEVEPSIFGSDGVTDVTLELMTSREWIELGSQVLVMPGGGHGLYYGSERGEKGVAGLEGFVGKVIEVVD